MPLTIDAANTLHPQSTVTSLALSPDGSFMVWGGEDEHLSICSTTSAEADVKIAVDGGVGKVAITSEEMVVVGSHSGDLHAYEKKGGHRWTQSLGGGCDHLAISQSGSLVAAIDGARLLHLIDGRGSLLAHFGAGELVLLAVHPRGESVAVADDVGNVSVVGRNGQLIFARPARGEQGERITAMAYCEDGHLCIARESIDVTLGDEEEIVIEWWTPLGAEADRHPLRHPCEVMRPAAGGIVCGMFDGEVVQFDRERSPHRRYKSPYSIHDLLVFGDDLLVATWFHVHMIDGSGEEKWQVEHTGLTEMVCMSNDGRVIAVGGDNQNDYTRETQVLVLDSAAKPYLMESGADMDADLRQFSTASPAQVQKVTAEALYGEDEDYSSLLTESELKQMQGGGGAAPSGADDLLGLLEAEITLTNATQEEFDFEAALSESAGRINMPPIADAGEDQIVAADEDGTAIVKLDGSRSYDEDGEIVAHIWRDVSNRVIGEAPVIKVRLPKGNHTFTLTVTDNDKASTSDAVTVQVR